MTFGVGGNNPSYRMWPYPFMLIYLRFSNWAVVVFIGGGGVIKKKLQAALIHSSIRLIQLDVTPVK